MVEIIVLLSNIRQAVSTTEWRQLRVLVPAVLAMTGQVTMLNIARWTGKGGSYPTILRFYNASLMWLQINWCLSGHHLKAVGGIFLLVGDETVVTKSGKQTYGLDRYFSSIYKRVVPGLSFFWHLFGERRRAALDDDAGGTAAERRVDQCAKAPEGREKERQQEAPETGQIQRGASPGQQKQESA